jgi:hypothetical protein
MGVVAPERLASRRAGIDTGCILGPAVQAIVVKRRCIIDQADVPSLLADWSIRTIETVCATGRVETDRYDFKRQLPDGETLTKLCCSFANSAGGFVVVGVREDGGGFSPTGMPPDTRIAESFGQKLRADPSIPYEPPKPIAVPETVNVIYVFHIPQSPKRPHLPMDRDKRYFWKRTNAGCEQMTLEEVRSLFLDYEGRRRLLALLYWHINSFRITASLATSLSIGKMPPPGPDINGIDQIVPDLWPLLHDHPELIDLLFSVRLWARAMAEDASLARLHMATVGKDVKPTFLGEYVKNMAERGRRGVELADALLATLDTKFEIEPSLRYQPSGTVAALIRDAEY